MSLVWKITVFLVVLCICYVSTVQQCSCIERKTCFARNGTVSTKSTESSKQCQGEEVLCCGTVSQNLQDLLQEPKVAPGGGCGRKRPPPVSDIITAGTPPSETVFYGEAPWTVLILEQNMKLRCSGSLISPKIVLTAAHCMDWDRNTSTLFVKAGQYNSGVKNKSVPSQLRSVHKTIPHPGFNIHNITNDIAILVLEQPMEINGIVDVICKPEEGQEVIANECVLTGFGYDSNDDHNSRLNPVLKKINYIYKSTDYCFEEMKSANATKLYHESNICAISQKDISAEMGDGGGPLFCPLKADPNKMVQIGIVSWHVTGKEKFPTAFTSLKYYLPWLKEQLKVL